MHGGHNGSNKDLLLPTPLVQGYLAHKKTPPPPYDPTVTLCLGQSGVPRGVGEVPLHAGLCPHNSACNEPGLSAGVVRTGGADVVRKEAWLFYGTSSGVRLCWELEEPKVPKRRDIQNGAFP